MNRRMYLFLTYCIVDREEDEEEELDEEEEALATDAIVKTMLNHQSKVNDFLSEIAKYENITIVHQTDSIHDDDEYVRLYERIILEMREDYNLTVDALHQEILSRHSEE